MCKAYDVEGWEELQKECGRLVDHLVSPPVGAYHHAYLLLLLPQHLGAASVVASADLEVFAALAASSVDPAAFAGALAAVVVASIAWLGKHG